MKYLPGALTSADLDILKNPYFGGEWAVFLTAKPAKLIASIAMTAAAAGTLTDNPATVITAGGKDLQVVVRNPITNPAAATVITLACLDDSATPVTMNGVATFTPETWQNVASFNFQRGYARDLLPATANKKYTAITALTSITGGAGGAAFEIYELPELADYYMIGCTDEIRFNTRASESKGVDCGMETDAFVKAGKSRPGELSISSKLKSFATGLARYAGQKTTAMLVGVKDGLLTGDRLVFTEHRVSNEINLPDGDGVAMETSNGKFVELLMFVAPYS